MHSIVLRILILLVPAGFTILKARNDWIVAKKNVSTEKKGALHRLRRDTIVCSVVTVLLGFVLFRSDVSEKLRNEKLATARHGELTSKSGTIDTNISKLATHGSDLLTALATNKGIDPSIRVAILQ